MKQLFLTAFLFVLVSCQAADLLKSPDGTIAVQVFVNREGALGYSVTYKNKQVIEPSVLGITVNGIRLGDGVIIGTSKKTVVDETYATRGNHPKARNYYRLWEYPVTHKSSGKKFALQFRLYNDGVAYRYIVPGKGAQHVDGESSSWKIMDGATTWYFERLAKGWKLKSYAGEWLSAPINGFENVSPVGPVQGTPLVFKLPGNLGYAAITKAALYNYSGMRLKAIGNRTLVADFTEADNGFDVAGTITTPWHATLLASNLNELVNSDFIANLNPAPDPELFASQEYIKPGRCVWRFETLNTGNPEEEQAFVDHAAQLGSEYTLIDEGWKKWATPWLSLKKITDYATTKNVGVWVWVHSRDIDNPYDNYKRMAGYMDSLVDAGVVGVKIDFMDSEAKEKIDFETAALTLAAKRKLMVNFHGCHSANGEARTFPNEMTREGIRGLEVNKMAEGLLTASHNAALPFTRFVTGHADYTPLTFTKPGPTTWAHQIATLVLFNSPLQVYNEDPEYMKNHPKAKLALDVIKSIPTTWDETLVLRGSEIGKLAGFARRKGNDWFVGVINGEAAKNYDLDLSFLPGGNYDATIVQDDANATPVNLIGANRKANLKQYTTVVPFKRDNKVVNNKSHINLPMSDGGGFVVVLIRK